MYAFFLAAPYFRVLAWAASRAMLYRPLSLAHRGRVPRRPGLCCGLAAAEECLKIVLWKNQCQKIRFFHDVFGVLCFQKWAPIRPLDWIFHPKIKSFHGVSLWKQADRKKDRKKTNFFLDIGCIGFYICTPKTEVTGFWNGKRFRKKSCKSICQIKKEFYFCTR